MTDLLRSPLHDRHVALGAKLADFGGWEMPIEYAASGGGVLKEHAAVRDAVGIFDVSHLGKATVRGAGARDVRQRLPDQRPRPDRARAGAVHAVLRRIGRRGRRPDRLPRQRRRGVPRPERGQHGRGRAPARGGRAGRHRGDGPAPGLRRPRRAGPALGRGARPARPADRPGLHGLRRRRLRRPPGAHLPHRLHRRARLRADPERGRQRGAVGCAGRDRPRGGRDAGRSRRPRHACAPRWATRCTGRTCRSTSPRCRPGRGGRSAGEGRVLGPRRAERRARRRPGATAVWRRVPRSRHPAPAHAGAVR